MRAETFLDHDDREEMFWAILQPRVLRGQLSASSEQDKRALPERHSNTRWPGARLGPGGDVWLVVDLASWKRKS